MFNIIFYAITFCFAIPYYLIVAEFITKYLKKSVEFENTK